MRDEVGVVSGEIGRQTRGGALAGNRTSGAATSNGRLPQIGGAGNGHRTQVYCSMKCIPMGHGKTYGSSWSKLDATKQPTKEDTILAAGWFEGEGNARWCGSEVASVSQNDKWILNKLRDWFGGSVGEQAHGCHHWRACGRRARRFLQMIYPWLSPWRKRQVDSVLKKNRHRLEAMP